MKFLIMSLAILFLGACTKSGPSPILQPIADAGCAVESAITGGFGAEVVSACAGTDAAACGAAFQTALGNVNLCQAPIPAPPAGTLKAADAPEWKRVGDVTFDQLKGKAKASAAVMPQGIIGAIACPMAVQTVLGLLTASIPTACGCTKNLNAGQMGSALIAACVAAVPI